MPLAKLVLGVMVSVRFWPTLSPPAIWSRPLPLVPGVTLGVLRLKSRIELLARLKGAGMERAGGAAVSRRNRAAAGHRDSANGAGAAQGARAIDVHARAAERAGDRQVAAVDRHRAGKSHAGVAERQGAGARLDQIPAAADRQRAGVGVGTIEDQRGAVHDGAGANVAGRAAAPICSVPPLIVVVPVYK